MMINKEDILKALDFRAFYQSYISKLNVSGNGQATGLCPFHDDHNPSFSVNLANGLWNCLAGCGGGDVFDFYKKHKGVDFPTALKEIAEGQGITSPPPHPIYTREPGKVKQRTVASFHYKDVDGTLLYSKDRIEPGREGRKKEFIFKSNAGNSRGCDPVLYNLPGISKAKEIIFVEGEAKADFLNNWGLPATCLDSGAQSKWRDEYTAVLKGKEKAVILPDNDLPGRTYAMTVANALHGHIDEIKIVDLPDLPGKGDVLDWKEEPGNDKARLIELIKAAPKWKKPSPIISTLELVADPNKEPLQWLLDGIIPKGAVVLLAGEPGAFKTWFALSLAKCVSEGSSFLDRRTEKTEVFYIDRENPETLVIDRLNKIGRSKDFNYWGLWREPEPPLLGDPWYIELAKGKPLIVIDTLIKFHESDENSSREMAKVSKALTAIRDAGATLLVLHHKGKGGISEYRGSSEIVGGVDVAYSISKGKENEKILSLKGIKNRFIVEPNLTLEVESSENNFYFEDISREKERVKEFEAKERIDTIKDAIETLEKEKGEKPKQGEIIEALKDSLGRNEVTRLLGKYVGIHWQIEEGKHGSKIYSLLEPSHLPGMYREWETGTFELMEGII